MLTNLTPMAASARLQRGLKGTDPNASLSQPVTEPSARRTASNHEKGSLTMKQLRGFAKFVVAVITPILLVIGGATLAALGISNGSSFLVWTGLIIAAVGLLWGGLFLLLYGPTDFLS